MARLINMAFRSGDRAGTAAVRSIMKPVNIIYALLAMGAEMICLFIATGVWSVVMEKFGPTTTTFGTWVKKQAKDLTGFEDTKIASIWDDALGVLKLRTILKLCSLGGI